MRNLLIISLLAFIGFSCKTTQNIVSKNSYEQMLDSSKVFSHNFTGFSLYDLEKQQTIFERNADRYFTPASITKLYTFYACIKTLGDSIPALRYTIHGDSLVFWGTGDPTFLHPDIKNTKVLDFLKSQRKTKQFYFSDANFTNEALGLGWSWDDYNDSFQPELSPFPMYGNIVRVKLKNGERDIQPEIFKNNFYKGKNDGEYIKRTLNDNQYIVPKNLAASTEYKQNIPFKTSTALIQQLLMDTLHKNVSLLKVTVSADAKTIYSHPIEPIYRTMLQESDNFLAEHLLLLCGAATKDSINSSFVIDYITKKYLEDLPDAPHWVDGSGISRYNLFTPRATIKLLQKIYTELPQEKLFSLLAIGGKTGTTRNMFKSENPYVFAKSGSMTGVYNLSGYLLTKQNKVLLFSMMNNNFNNLTRDIRKETEKILTWIHENY
jgi:serine-type D-Ala-D-Ala carboxypeptidase/endopeptidase (penicillin-binding protein 4)